MKNSTSIFELIKNQGNELFQEVSKQILESQQVLLEFPSSNVFSLLLELNKNFIQLSEESDNESKFVLCKTDSTFLNTNSCSKDAFVIIINDRSFVTDSVLNFINQEEVGVGFFLNALITVKSKNYAVIYCETLSSLSESFTEELFTLLTNVRLVNDEWKDMIFEINRFSATLPDEEVRDFLTWLVDSNFLLWSSSTYNSANLTTSLGLREPCSITSDTISSLLKKKSKTLTDSKKVNITSFKSTNISTIHRREYCDVINIQYGKAFLSIFGMFSLNSYRSKVTNIPLLRRKAQDIADVCKVRSNGYDVRSLYLFLNSLFRGELLGMSQENLITSSKNFISKTKVNKPLFRCYSDASRKYLIIAVFMARKRISNEDIEKIYNVINSSTENNGIRTVFYTGGVADIMSARFMVKVSEDFQLDNAETDLLISKLDASLESWNDKVIELLGKSSLVKKSNLKSSSIMQKYKKALPRDYTIKEAPEEAVIDIIAIEENILNGLPARNQCYTLFLQQNANDEKGDNSEIFLRIYHSSDFSNEISFHVISNILEKLDLKMIVAESYKIKLESSVFIHHLRVEFPTYYSADSIEEFIRKKDSQENFSHIFRSILSGNVVNDALNKLAIYAHLKEEEIVLIKLFIAYLQQIQFSYPSTTVESVLCTEAELTKLFIGYFKKKFDPSIDAESRLEGMAKMKQNITDKFLSLTNPITEKILSQVYALVNSAIRTNFFLSSSALSVKFNPKDIPNMPLPVTFREIFVYSANFQGIHLRNGKVARGGIRWSDRKDDFRTEILDLVKAQTTKNALIVPTGAKGGFCIMHDTQYSSREQFLELGKEYYSEFISACLDITDSLLPDKSVTCNPNLVNYDENDPYFVVAADKGTAQFSDIANGISKKYNFWLRDAFASGGSVGYDHKKIGITAKGAWISVQHHLLEMGTDIQTEDFTCVGIGDMSGDVFGNGMLLSKKTRLIAAFNHLHIFFDPNPDSSSSFKERKRMFELPRSSWSDYNPRKLSKGGKVYGRTDTSCVLTPQIREALKTKEESLSPDDLIKEILKMECDLLWNGGIGTYVKASTETHADARDKANTALRINGNELRCRVVGEGGNLGFTQLGRIEYSQLGGLINTDAIDNCGGVNCSDHEVNIKILLNILVDKKRITNEQREELLKNMTNDVEELVLEHNRLQSRVITVSTTVRKDKLDDQEQLMKKLESIGLLNRKIEFLPSTEEVIKRKVNGQSLSRPELCVLFGYSKMHLRSLISVSNIPNLDFFENRVLSYFPEQMQKSFPEEIKHHPLRGEIITTSVSNSIVDRVGIAFISSIESETKRSIEDIIMAYFFVIEVLDMEKLWNKINKISTPDTSGRRSVLLVQTKNIVSYLIKWALESYDPLPEMETFVSTYKPKIVELKSILKPILNSENNLQFKPTFKQKQLANMPELTFTDGFSDAFDEVFTIVEITKLINLLSYDAKKIKMQYAIELYYLVENVVLVAEINRLAEVYTKNNSGYWNKFASRGMQQEIYRYCAKIVLNILSSANQDESVVELFSSWHSCNEGNISEIKNFISEIKLLDSVDFSVLSIISTKFRVFFRS